MEDNLKNLADIYYAKILSPSSGIGISWLRNTLAGLGIKDESIEKLYSINAPISREVWYYIFMKIWEEKKLADFLNILIDKVGSVDLGQIKDKLSSMGLIYRNGKFERKIFKIIVLVSGRGTNLQAIIDAIEKGKINGEIVGVISNKKKAYALQRAKNHGIETFYIPHKKDESREEYDKKLAKIIDEKRADLIVLAGFLRILSSWFVRKYKWKIINIHPALLPAFAGLYGENVHKAVLDYGCKVSGCTVHFVDEEVDHGPIIIQKCVEVLDDDTAESLAQRILEKEHESLVEAIKLISEGRIKIEGRRVKIS